MRTREPAAGRCSAARFAHYRSKLEIFGTLFVAGLLLTIARWQGWP